MKRIVLACMDCRMNGILEEDYGDDDTVIVRNAGANVAGLKGTLRELVKSNGVEEIRIIPHTDCGAMKAVVLRLKDNDSRIDDSTFDTLVGQFELLYKEGEIENNEDVEEFSPEIQRKSAAGMCKRVTSELVELEEGVPKGKHVLLVLGPSKVSDYVRVFKAVKEDPHHCYMIQARQEDVINDIKLAVRVLGIRDIYFVSLPGDDRKREAVEEALKSAFSEEEYRGIRLGFARI